MHCSSASSTSCCTGAIHPRSLHSSRKCRPVLAVATAATRSSGAPVARQTWARNAKSTWLAATWVVIWPWAVLISLPIIATKTANSTRWATQVLSASPVKTLSSTNATLGRAGNKRMAYCSERPPVAMTTWAALFWAATSTAWMTLARQAAVL